jgi:gliding motility-associated-like protein
VIHEYQFDGDYTVSLKVTNVDGCFTTLSYTNYITVHPNPVASFIYSPYNPSTINSEVRFTDYSTDADLWEWSFGAIGNSNVENPTFLFPEIAGEYPVELIVATNQGCADTLVKIVTVYQEHLIFVPNVITPDGDQFNEVFTPYFTGIDIYDYHLTIYNRWGEILFESYNLATGWNGTYGGEIVPDGVYIWTVETADVATDKRFEFNGHVTVIK